MNLRIGAKSVAEFARLPKILVRSSLIRRKEEVATKARGH